MCLYAYEVLLIFTFNGRFISRRLGDETRRDDCPHFWEAAGVYFISDVFFPFLSPFRSSEHLTHISILRVIYRSNMLCKNCENIFHGHMSIGLVAEVYSEHYRPHSNGANIQLSATDGCQICSLLWDQMNAYSLSGQYRWATELLKATTAYFLASESVPAAGSPLYVLFFRTTWGELANTTLPLGIMPCMLFIM
jgi:hypothetical protein